MHNKPPSTITAASASGKHVGDGCVGPSLPCMCQKNRLDQVFVLVLEFEERALIVSGQSGFYGFGKQQSIIVNCTIRMTTEARVQLATGPILDTIVNSKWTARAKNWKSTIEDGKSLESADFRKGAWPRFGSPTPQRLVLDGVNDPA